MRFSVAAAIACLCAGGLSAAEDVKAAIRRNTDIPAQGLGPALQILAKEHRFQIVYVSDEVNSLRTQGASGELTVEEALTQILRGTGLTFRSFGDNAMSIEPVAAGVAPADRRSTSDVKESAGWFRALRLAQADETSGELPASARGPTGDSQTAEQRVSALEEVIVTAQKRSERLQDVPMSVRALSSDELLKRGIVNTVDIALSIPGVAVQDRGGASRSRYIFMRGLGNTFGSIAMVGVYLDEQDITGFPFYALDIRGYDLARLEVLRGPQGTLYGSGAMGGVLRYVTNPVNLSSTTGDQYISLSTTEDGDPSAEASASLNLPIIEDKLGMRISGFYSNGGGWIDQPAVNKQDINDEDLYSFRAKTLWRPTEAFELSAMAMMQRNDTGAGNVGEDDNGDFTQRFGRTTTPSGTGDFETYNLVATYTGAGLQVVSSSGYLDLRTTINESGYILPVLPAPALPFQVLFLNDAIATRSFAQELRVSSVGTGRFGWSLGGSYREAELRENGAFLFGQTAASAQTVPQAGDSGTEAWAVFGEGSMQIMERLKIGAGLRYFQDKQYNVLLKQLGDFDQVSPRFFAVYTLNPDVNVYANVAKGFRSGGFNLPAAVSAGAPATFDSDVVWSYELGSKGELISDRVNFDVALFYTDYTGAQDTGAQLINNRLISLSGNLGDAVIKGVDWDITVHLTGALSFGTSGEYLDGEYTRIKAPQATVAVGDTLKQIPKYRTGVWGEYQFGPWLGGDDAYFRIDYNRQGEAVYRNRRVSGVTPWYFSVSDKIDMLNASIGWEKNNWQLSVHARNLLDDRGFIDGESLEQLAARSRPRSYGLTVRYAFQ